MEVLHYLKIFDIQFVSTFQSKFLYEFYILVVYCISLLIVAAVIPILNFTIHKLWWGSCTCIHSGWYFYDFRKPDFLHPWALSLPLTQHWRLVLVRLRLELHIFITTVIRVMKRWKFCARVISLMVSVFVVIMKASLCEYAGRLSYI